MAYESVRYANRLKIPVIVDIRDLWPDTFLAPIGNDYLQFIAQGILWRDFKKVSKLLKTADALTAMSQGCLDWGLAKSRRVQNERDRVFYLGYRKNRNIIAELPDKKETASDKKMFLFIGTFGKSYELDLILDVAQRFSKSGQNDILFTLAGNGQQFETVRSNAKNLPNVILPGWLEENDIHRLLQQAWAGLVPCKSVEHAAPNKVFEYLSAGVPLISSLEGEIAGLIDRYKIGLNYLPGDVDGLFSVVQKMASENSLRENMAINSCNFFDAYGDADNIYSEYADFIEEIAKKHRP